VESDFLAELAKALHIGDRELTEALAKGADVNATRGYPAGNTPLHSAVRAGRKDIVELLIAKGEGVNAKNNDGQTPVDVAISRRRKEIVELLIAKGADVSLHVAARFGALTKHRKHRIFHTYNFRYLPHSQLRHSNSLTLLIPWILLNSA